MWDDAAASDNDIRSTDLYEFNIFICYSLFVRENSQ